MNVYLTSIDTLGNIVETRHDMSWMNCMEFCAVFGFICVKSCWCRVIPTFRKFHYEFSNIPMSWGLFDAHTIDMHIIWNVIAEIAWPIQIFTRYVYIEWKSSIVFFLLTCAISFENQSASSSTGFSEASFDFSASSNIFPRERFPV